MSKYVIIDNPLKGFEEANTSSQSQGYIQSGKYLLEELKENHPTTDTDYARISIPQLGEEETWICIRWKKRSYATIEEINILPFNPISFQNDDDAITESKLIELLPHFYDFGYDLDRARYPYKIKGFKAPLAPPGSKNNNCCTFVEALIVKAWENSFDDFKWDLERHKQMMVYSAEDYFSPVTALLEADMGERVVDSDQIPHPWTVIQGWRKQWTSGHTFIILGHHEETDRVLTMESNSYHKLNGVGYRMIGNIKDYNQPPNNWWENKELWTWERIKSVYKYRKQCILRVKDQNWV